jgi:excisionase family DNA binding protein
MTAQDRSDFVSVAEAARRLGVSTATVKRRIRDGSLEAEPLSRPQGIEYRVRLPRDVTPALTAPDSDVPGALSEVSALLAERSDSEKPPLNGSAHVTTQDILVAITAAVAPLTERLAVQDATIARQAETIQQQSGVIAELREDRGRLTAEIEALRTSQAQQGANPGPEAPALTTDALVPLPARLSYLAPWVLLVATLGVVAFALALSR